MVWILKDPIAGIYCILQKHVQIANEMDGFIPHQWAGFEANVLVPLTLWSMQLDERIGCNLATL